MEKLTYRQAYDKIIDAYFRDEIRILDNEFCFCGNLAGNGNWQRDNYKATEHFYSIAEYKKMEMTLFKEFDKNPAILLDNAENNPLWEDRLFSGMTAALEVLKQIHIDRGEIIDEVRGLVKREIRTPTGK